MVARGDVVCLCGAVDQRQVVRVSETGRFVLLDPPAPAPSIEVRAPSLAGEMGPIRGAWVNVANLRPVRVRRPAGRTEVRARGQRTEDRGQTV